MTLDRLAVLEPDPAHGARVRARCLAALAQDRPPASAWHFVVALLSVSYLAAVAIDVLWLLRL